MLVYFTALMFALQGYITQTHLHVEPNGAYQVSTHEVEQVLVGFLSFDHKTDHDGPRHQDSANCPICQQIQSAGLFFSSNGNFLLTPLAEYVSLGREFTTQITDVAFSHDWRGRAPPISN